jgi:hypothetical protein
MGLSKHRRLDRFELIIEVHRHCIDLPFSILIHAQFFHIYAVFPILSRIYALTRLRIPLGVVIILSFVQMLLSYVDSGDKEKSRDNNTSIGEPKAESMDGHHMKPAFRWFQLQYLAVFLTVMLADWLQGTNMYTLYAVSRIYV